MAIVIHNIGKNRYAYEHYRDGKQIKSKYIGPVDAKGNIRDVKVGEGVDRQPVGTTTESLRHIYMKAVKRKATETKSVVKRKASPYEPPAKKEYERGMYGKSTVTAKRVEVPKKVDKKPTKQWTDKLESTGLKEKHSRFSGHSFKKGMNIKLYLKDESRVGDVYKYKDDGYDEEYVIEKEVADSQLSFGNDFFGDGKGGKYASTGAISVAPNLRNKGIGAALVKRQEDIARNRGAEQYYITNVSNKRFWEKMGYKRINDRLFVKDL